MSRSLIRFCQYQVTRRRHHLLLPTRVHVCDVWQYKCIHRGDLLCNQRFFQEGQFSYRRYSKKISIQIPTLHVTKDNELFEPKSLKEYNILIKKAAADRNPYNAESLVSKLEHDCNVQPNIESYNALIEAWAFYDGKEQSVVRAERWFHRISEFKKQRSEKNGLRKDPSHSVDRLTPNTESYNLLLAALSRGKSKKATLKKAYALKSTDLLSDMKKAPECKPNTESYNRVMQAWVKCGRDSFVVQPVMELLKEMELASSETTLNNINSAYCDSINPNTLSYSIVINALGASAELKSRLKRRWGKMTDNSEDHDFNTDIEHAESLLNYMHDLHSAGVPDVCPDTQAYNTLIAAWSRTASPQNSDSPLRAESILRKMIELNGKGIATISPDVISYNTIIGAWLRVRSFRGAQRSEWWLRRMHESGDTLPNTETYNAVMKAWSIHDPFKTEELLQEMMDHDSAGNASCSPSTESFSISIGSFTRFEQTTSQLIPGDGCQRARRLLDKIANKAQDDLTNCSTNLDMFNNVLKAAATSKSSCFSVTDSAFHVLKLLKASRHNADCSTYKYLMQAVLKSDHEKVGKRKLVLRILDLCQEDGQLSRKIVRLLTQGKCRFRKWTLDDSKCLVDEYFSEFSISPSSYRNLASNDVPASNEDLRVVNCI